MARLTRKTAKVFGQTATSTGQDPQIGQFGSAKAGTYVGTGDIDEIQALPAWDNGWIDAVTPTQQFPPLPEMTGVQKVLSYQNAYVLQEGIPEYDAGTEYGIGSIVKTLDENGTPILYSSLTAPNIGNPLTSTENWALLELGGGSMPIGTIFQAIRTDIPANSLRLDGTEYTSGFTSFVTGYLATGKVISKSYAEWTTEYTMTNGCVPFFGYDEATGAFKTPIIPSGTFLAQAVQSGEFGSFLASSLKSHTHTANNTSSAGTHTHTRGTMEISGGFLSAQRTAEPWGAFAYTGEGGDDGDNDGHLGDRMDFYASRSWTGETSSNGAHTHSVTINATGGEDTYPKHVKYPFFVVVANTNAEEPSQADWDNFVGNLDTKANKSLNNIDTAGQQVITDNFNTNLNQKITNCILEAPHMVDLELADGVLTLKAGSKVIVPYGTSAPTMAIGDSLNGGTIVDISWDGEKLFYVVEQNSTLSQGYVGTANAQNYCFVNGANILSINWVNDFSSGTSTATEDIHYNPDTNLLYYQGNPVYNWTLPFGIVNCDASGNPTSITQTFQHIGYIGSTVWAMKGIKGLAPNGRNADGTLNNVECMITNILLCENTFNDLRNADLLIDSSNYDIRYIKYKEQDNINWDIYNNLIDHKCIVARISSDSTNKITVLVPKYPFQAVDYNSMISGEIPTIVESYVSGTSWYRIWSDGWCEQGGYIQRVSAVSFLKPYRDTAYSIVAVSLGTTNGIPRISGKANNYFSYAPAMDGECSANWVAYGYIS